MGTAEENPVTEGTVPVPSRTMKDSVFRDLFGIPEYLLELYQVLHPEDDTATESDLGDVTIKNVLMVKIRTMTWHLPSVTGSL